jgi:hypothetical protein
MFVVWALVTLAIGAGVIALPIALDGRFAPATIVPLAAALVMAALALRYAWRQRVVAATAVAILGSVVVVAPTLQWVLPRVDAFWLSRGAARLVAANAPAGRHPLVASIGYQEPSLVFLLGRDTALIAAADVPGFLRGHPEALLLLGNNVEADVMGALKSAGRPVTALGSVRGFNYSKGRWLTLTLYRPVPVPPDGVVSTMDRAALPPPALEPAG